MSSTPRILRRRIKSVDAVGWLTFYVILLLFIPSRIVVGPLGSAGSLSMLAGLGSLLLWFISLLSTDRRELTHPQPIRIALAVLLFCVGISYVSAMAGPINPDEISPADVALLALASWSGTLLLTHDAIHQRTRLDTLVWRVAVCGGLIAVLGLVQIFTRELWVDRFTIPGMLNLPAEGLSSRGGYPRPPGTAIHPIEYGVLLAMLLPFSLHVGFFHTHRRTWVRWLPALALALVIPLTSSRSAYLGAFIALAVVMTDWSRARRRLVIFVGMVGILAMALVVPSFFSSVIGLFSNAAEDPSITSRTDSFSVAYEFLARDPWFGRGLGTFLPKYRIFDNQYLVLLVSIGIVGTLAFLALGLVALVTLVRMRKHVPEPGTRNLAISLAAAASAGFSCLFMFDAFAFPMTAGVLFFVLGLAGALNRLEQLTPDTAHGMSSPSSG